MAKSNNVPEVIKVTAIVALPEGGTALAIPVDELVRICHITCDDEVQDWVLGIMQDALNNTKFPDRKPVDGSIRADASWNF